MIRPEQLTEQELVNAALYFMQKETEQLDSNIDVVDVTLSLFNDELQLWDNNSDGTPNQLLKYYK